MYKLKQKAWWITLVIISLEAASGLSRKMLDKISEMTGLVFEYKIYGTLAGGLRSNSDIAVGIPPNYAPPGMALSVPFLRSATILYTNSSLDSNDLGDKIYAAVRGSALPEGIKEENAVYYNTREESISAVNSGKADYGYGNAYSVAFYTLQNGYKNIITIPKEKEPRAYCIGIVKEDKVLLSIINKAIHAIDEQQMQVLILDVTSHIDRKVTPSMIVDAYGKELLLTISLAIGLLLFGVVSNIRAKNKLQVQNTRYELLSQISNEYLYEYYAATNQFVLSEKIQALFDQQGDYGEAIERLRAILMQTDRLEDSCIIRLPLPRGKMGTFKSVSSVVYDSHKRLHSIIGKLVDISEETAEKEELIAKAQVDGLTGLYNAVTIKELIIKRMATKPAGETDAFVLMGFDRFKDINDTFGHLAGNQILADVGEVLKRALRKTDKIGRMGGDEFCVYMNDIPSAEFVRKKCMELNKALRRMSKDIPASASIGFALLREEGTYEELFEKADKALYYAKRKGAAQVADYREI